ncbi:MAG: DUF2070 family protein [Nitrososphaerales archaeon]
MAELGYDSTRNIARRYRHLFRLPSTAQSVIYTSIPAVLTTLIARSITRSALPSLALYALATEALLLVAIEIDQRVLKNKIGTFRRLAGISIISNLLWFFLAILATLVFLVSGDEPRSIALVTLGPFLAVSFRALIFGSVFYDSPIRALPLAAVQPVLLAVPIELFPNLLSPRFSLPILASIAGGVVLIIAIEAYLASINRSTNLAEFKPLRILQSFLKAWTIEDATMMERLLDSVSRETSVKTTMITIENADAASAMMVVPGIHPGPFYPIGSSNLPADIYMRLKTDRVIPLTVHSISDHDLNLPSKSEVESYVASLKEAKQIDEGQSMTRPVIKRKNKATVTALALGSVAIIALTQAPYGMEDFPVSVRKSIEEYADAKGFKSSFVIDTHNSEGPKPSEQECEDVVKAAKEAISELTGEKQETFSVGFAHSSELIPQKISTSKDVGPAGVGLLLFEVGGSSFNIAIVDANNSKLGFRESSFQVFERKTGSKILELCTSDTHVTAAKTMGAKGYLALGDLISADEFASLLALLYDRAKNRIGTGHFSATQAISRVKTIGAEVLNEFSGLMDSALSTAKRGAKVFGILTALIALVVVIL